MCVKKIFMMLTLAMLAQFGWGQEVSYQLSSHILDINKGAPAADVKIRLSKLEIKTDTWIQVAEKTTDINGRVKDFLPKEGTNHQSIYKLTYETAPYFEAQQQDPFIEVVFEIKDDKHYHVPITLSPFGYSTYRGN